MARFSHGRAGGPGSVSVIDFATDRVEATWPVPGGGSPDMGNVSADGRTLWLSGRFDDVVYAFHTGTGRVTTIAVGREPHGLAVWPQPGRYSLGHTRNMRVSVEPIGSGPRHPSRSGRVPNRLTAPCRTRPD